ncbi:unnamed protein product [Mucor hiemalis]
MVNPINGPDAIIEEAIPLTELPSATNSNSNPNTSGHSRAPNHQSAVQRSQSNCPQPSSNLSQPLPVMYLMPQFVIPPPVYNPTNGASQCYQPSSYPSTHFLPSSLPYPQQFNQSIPPNFYPQQSSVVQASSASSFQIPQYQFERNIQGNSFANPNESSFSSASTTMRFFDMMPRKRKRYTFKK